MGSSMENGFQSQSIEASTRSCFFREKKQTPHPDITLKTISYKKLLPKTFGNVS